MKADSILTRIATIQWFMERAQANPEDHLIGRRIANEAEILLPELANFIGSDDFQLVDKNQQKTILKAFNNLHA